MEKIKPYLLPGLLIFYLVFSVGMIPIGYLVNRVGNARVAHFLLAAGLVVLASQWLLATIWTTFGPGKFLQRLIPCFLCVLLALLAFEQSRCLMSWGDDAMIDRWKYATPHTSFARQWKCVGWLFVFVPAATWVLVVITLYILQIIPGMRWCLTVNGDERQLTSPPLRRLSRLGLLCLAVTACGAVVMANRTLFQATGWTGTIAVQIKITNQHGDLFVFALVAAISVSILVLMNLTLSRFTDWILYRRNWLIFATLITTFTACVVCIFKSTHTHDIEGPLARAALLLGLLLTQLLVGVAGYRLRYRRPDNHTNLASPPGSLIQPTTETRQTWGHGPLDKLAIIGALAILAISIPTGFHKKMTVMNFGQGTPRLGFLDGELMAVRIDPGGTVRSFSFLDGYPNLVVLRIHGRWDTHINEAGMRSLQRLHQNLQFGLGGLNIAYCGFDADHLQYIADFTRLKDLNLWNTPTTDASLVHLKGFVNLENLHLGSTSLTGEGLKHLKGLKKLQTLRFSDTPITDAGLIHLTGLTNLQTLDLDGTQLTDAAVKHLTRLTQLQHLDVSRTKISPTGMAMLHKTFPGRVFENLHRFVEGSNDIYGTPQYLSRLAPRDSEGHIEALYLKGRTSFNVYAKGGPQPIAFMLKYAKQLPHLTSLNLDDTNMVDEIMHHLAELTQLEYLNISSSYVTDTGLVHLEGLTNLKTLHLVDTFVTDAGVAELQKALPDCEISH